MTILFLLFHWQYLLWFFCCISKSINIRKSKLNAKRFHVIKIPQIFYLLFIVTKFFILTSMPGQIWRSETWSFPPLISFIIIIIVRIDERDDRRQSIYCTFYSFNEHMHWNGTCTRFDRNLHALTSISNSCTNKINDVWFIVRVWIRITNSKKKMNLISFEIHYVLVYVVCTAYETCIVF